MSCVFAHMNDGPGVTDNEVYLRKGPTDRQTLAGLFLNTHPKNDRVNAPGSS